MSRGSGPHVLRLLSAGAVLDALRSAGSLRVAELMERTGLTRPTVAQALSLLEAEGWVLSSPDPDGGRMGRPAQLLRFNAGAGYVLGVDVGPHKVLAVVADLVGTVVGQQRSDSSAANGGVEVMAIVQATMAAALAAAGISADRLYSVALGTPGVVDARLGTVRLAPSIPGWASIPIVQELRGRFSCPISIDNDVNLAVLAEQWDIDDEPPQTLVFIQWGARMGAGIMIGGRLHRGAASAAGEIGFIDLAEAPTPAGRMGAFEQLVAAEAIAALAAERGATRDPHDVSGVLRAATDGDPAALEVVEIVAARFARGVAPMLLILDPDLVVIGGGVSGGGLVLLDAVTRHLGTRTLLAPRLALSRLGDRSVALGAVRLALDEVQERLLTPAGLTGFSQVRLPSPKDGV